MSKCWDWDHTFSGTSCQGWSIHNHLFTRRKKSHLNALSKSTQYSDVPSSILSKACRALQGRLASLLQASSETNESASPQWHLGGAVRKPWELRRLHRLQFERALRSASVAILSKKTGACGTGALNGITSCGVAGERRENLPHRSSETISLCHVFTLSLAW